MRFLSILSLCACLPLLACNEENDGHGDAREDLGISDLAGVDFAGPNPELQIEPSTLQTLTVMRGQNTPNVGFTATLGGLPVEVGWSVDRGDVGSVPPGPTAAATVSPSGITGGLLTVRARLGLTTISRQVFVKLSGGVQNGADATNPDEQKQIPATVGDLSAGGGVGGVGGEGLGGAVSDPPTMTALATPTSNGTAEMLKLLYPYDATVWPRGMLAPLLMWSSTLGDADAIKIELSTDSGSFSWTGTFGRPAILATTMGKFIRHPIPQDIWTLATNTAGGVTPNGTPDKVTMKLTVAKGGQGYGPIAQTWAIAPARLTGTVYYNSYGTLLVKNWSTLDSAGHTVGAAVLGIRSGDLGPKLVIGKNSPIVNGKPTNEGCRVCHIVSSRGRWIIAQAEANSNKQTWLYDLNSTDVQGSAASLTPQGKFAWSAMTGPGDYTLTNTVDPSSSNPAIAGGNNNTAVSSFWQFGTAPVMQPLTGLPATLAAGYPGYSPDDKKIAFVDATGTNKDLKGRPIQIADYDASTHAFSNLSTVYTPPAALRAGYPAFLPDNSALVFENQVRQGGDTVVTTRNCARSELWWTKLGGTPTSVALGNINGKAGATSYLPTAGKNHGIAQTGDPQCGQNETGFDDTTLNYEPTVLPIISGGYAWVVFTSRRLYGNQLNEFPWNSWPANYDTTDLKQAPVKKLWVAAIDLNAPAGTDPSHPAFYLPAQEILAGNSRGFWVLDPCRADGLTCESGDQCCNGFCEPDPANPASLICSDTASCAGLQEKCAVAADCCDISNQCINGFCAGAPIL